MKKILHVDAKPAMITDWLRVVIVLFKQHTLSTSFPDNDISNLKWYSHSSDYLLLVSNETTTCMPHVRFEFQIAPINCNHFSILQTEKK